MGHAEDTKFDYMSYNDYEFIDKLSTCGSVDWHLKGRVSHIKDQKNCGSCWAHTTAAALETLYAIENNIHDTDKVP